MRIEHKSWNVSGKLHSYRFGSLAFLVRWDRLWFVLDYSPEDLSKELVIVNIGPLRGGQKCHKFWGGNSLDCDRYAWWHFPRRRA